YAKTVSTHLMRAIWSLVRRKAESQLRDIDLGGVSEQIAFVHIPGLGPLYRHTYRGDNGEQLPDVIYTQSPTPILVYHPVLLVALFPEVLRPSDGSSD